ncbi:MAG: DUF1207 domain-containing protein [Gemmatimonadales bacterium]
MRTAATIAFTLVLCVSGAEAQGGRDPGPLPRGDLFHPLLADPKQPQFFGFESLEVLASHELGNWRLYGGGEYLVRHEPADLDPALVHAGVEYRHAGALMRLGRLGAGRFVAALDAKSIQERKWQVGWAFRVGVEFGPAHRGPVLGRSWSVAIEGYDGPAPYGQSYGDNASSLGLGLHFTL